MLKPVTYCFMENYLPNLNTPSLSKRLLTKWFWTKEWLSFTKDLSLRHIRWQSWSELLAHFQLFYIQIMISTISKTDMNWPLNSSLKCPLWLPMLTELQWDFQSSNLKNTTDTWKIFFTWCSQTQCQKSLKLQIKSSELWRLFGFATLTMNKMHQLQLSELQEVPLRILLLVLQQVSDHCGDLIMVEQMKPSSQCCKKSFKKSWALKAFLKRLRIKTQLSDWWVSATEFIKTLTQERKSCKKCATMFST